MKIVASFWVRQTKEGENFLAGLTKEGQRFLMFKNKKKQKKNILIGYSTILGRLLVKSLIAVLFLLIRLINLKISFRGELASRVVDPHASGLLIVFVDSQTIYFQKRKKGKVISFFLLR